MSLREIKNKKFHYFEDDQDRLQGEYKVWYINGQQWIICHHRDGESHGEFKHWNSEGELELHTFDIDGKEIIDFLKTPELYPKTPEEKTMFALRYNIGGAPFIKESLD